MATKKPKRAAKVARSKGAVKKAKARKAPPKKAKAAKKAAPRKTTAAGDPVRALAKRIINVTVANDDDGTFALYADDVESKEMGQPPTRGVDALRSKFAGWRNMVSESHFEPKRVCIDGNTIVIEWLGKVKLAGSGKEAELHEVAIHEIRDGKIAQESFFYNPSALA